MPLIYLVPDSNELESIEIHDRLEKIIFHIKKHPAPLNKVSMLDKKNGLKKMVKYNLQYHHHFLKLVA